MYPPGQEDQAEPELEDGDNCKTKDSSKINYQMLMQEANFTLSSSSPEPKPKKRKSKITEPHGGGGGCRIVRAAGRKDRHSKVSTARGPRDRRLRLSPNTAIQFYDVQDRLGYDRPSKAIDWLIKEAKAAIEALDEQPLKNASKNQEMQLEIGGFSISECGLIQKNELFDENPVPGFGWAAPPCSAAFQGYPGHDLNPSRNGNGAPEDAILYPGYNQQGFCSDWETPRLQRILQCSVVSPPPPHFASVAPIPGGGGGQIFTQREPLQSSIINYSPIISNNFQGFNICSDELSNITAFGSLKQDEKDKRPVYTAPFLHYQD